MSWEFYRIPRVYKVGGITEYSEYMKEKSWGRLRRRESGTLQKSRRYKSRGLRNSQTLRLADFPSISDGEFGNAPYTWVRGFTERFVYVYGITRNGKHSLLSGRKRRINTPPRREDHALCHKEEGLPLEERLSSRKRGCRSPS